jgi:hypothetical protein
VAQAAPASNRFKISFSGVGIHTHEAASMGVYSVEGRIVVQFPTTECGVLKINNLAGQLVGIHQFANQTIVETNQSFAPGAYLVSVSTAAGTVTRKVFVK